MIVHLLWCVRLVKEWNAIHVDDAVFGRARSIRYPACPSEEEGSDNSEGKFIGNSRVEKAAGSMDSFG